nr:hypothetical protein Hi04_10k_c5016_00003 [uncultured bacterium]
MMTTFTHQNPTPSADCLQTANDSPSNKPVETSKVVDATQIVKAIEKGRLQVRRRDQRYEVLLGPDVVMSFPDQPLVYMTHRNEVRVVAKHRLPVLIQAKSPRDADVIARTLRHRFFAC